MAVAWNLGAFVGAPVLYHMSFGYSSTLLAKILAKTQLSLRNIAMQVFASEPLKTVVTYRGRILALLYRKPEQNGLKATGSP